MSVVLKEENSEGVRKVMKVSKVMSVKLEIEGLMIISACTPK